MTDHVGSRDCHTISRLRLILEVPLSLLGPERYGINGHYLVNVVNRKFCSENAMEQPRGVKYLAHYETEDPIASVEL